MRAQTCKPPLPLFLAPNLANSGAHFPAPAAVLSLPRFHLVAVMATAPGSAQAGTLQGEKFPPPSSLMALACRSTHHSLSVTR